MPKQKYFDDVVKSNLEVKTYDRKFSHIRSNGDFKSWRNENRLYGWYNEIFNNIYAPTKNLISHFGKYSDDGSYSDF